MIQIDGSILEGGGQILRVAIALSSITQQPVSISNIRAKRNPPGMRRQHVVAIKSVAALTESEVRGLHVGSKEVTFIPGKIRGGSFSFKIGTAGSTTLVLQAFIPVTSYAPKKVSIEIHGGTNNQMAPPVEYFQTVFLPILRKMNYTGNISLLRRGFYPKGEGLVRGEFYPARSLIPLNLTEAADVSKITGLSFSCKLPNHIPDRMAAEASHVLNKTGFENVEVNIQNLQDGDVGCSVNPGCGLILFAELTNGIRISADSLGEIGKSAERVGQEAAQNLIEQLKTKAPVDMHLGDQLIIWAGLADGQSRFHVSKLTPHTLTAIDVFQRILNVKFKIEGTLGHSAIITVNGVGLRNNYL